MKHEPFFLFWGCSPKSLAKFKGQPHSSAKVLTNLNHEAKAKLNRQKQIVREMQLQNFFKFLAKKG